MEIIGRYLLDGVREFGATFRDGWRWSWQTLGEVRQKIEEIGNAKNYRVRKKIVGSLYFMLLCDGGGSGLLGMVVIE